MENDSVDNLQLTTLASTLLACLVDARLVRGLVATCLDNYFPGSFQLPAL